MLFRRGSQICNLPSSGPGASLSTVATEGAEEKGPRRAPAPGLRNAAEWPVYRDRFRASAQSASDVQDLADLLEPIVKLMLADLDSTATHGTLRPIKMRDTTK